MKRADSKVSKEETKKEAPVMPLWKKDTPGTLVLRGPKRTLRLKPKQQFRALPEELGAYLDQFTLLEGKINKAEFPQLDDSLEPTEEEKFKAEHIGSGWFNVISPTGEIMNSKKLRGVDAEALVDSLQEDSE